MNASRLRIHSPHPPAECAARLISAMDREPTGLSFLRVSPTPPKPVIGQLNGNALRLCKRIDYRNSFQTALTAELFSEGTGTAIVGQFGMHPLVLAFMALWFGFLVVIGGTISVNAFLGRLHDHDRPFEFIPLLMLAFGVGLLLFGRYLARTEAFFMTEFLVRVLDAEDQLPARPTA